MKKIILMFVLISLGNFMNAQSILAASVPKAAEEKFETAFPNAKNVAWEKEGTNYKAQFNLDDTFMSAEFTSEGIYLQQEIQIDVPALPSAAMDYLIRNYSGRAASNAVKITNADGKINYKVKVEENELTFDENGKYVSMKKA